MSLSVICFFIILAILNNGLKENKDVPTNLCCLSDKLIKGKGAWKYLVDTLVLLY